MITLRAEHKATERIGKQVLPRLLAFFFPSGVRSAFGGRTLQRDEATCGGIVGRKRFVAGELTLPRIVHAKPHALITALEHGPAFGLDAWREIAEPNHHAVFGCGAGQKPPRDLGRSGGDLRRRLREQGGSGMHDRTATAHGFAKPMSARSGMHESDSIAIDRAE